jgi:hypothetical protein
MNYESERRGIPLKLDLDATRRASVASLARAALAVARAEPNSNPAEVARGLWPDDRAASIIARASTLPADLSNTSALARTIMPDFFATLGPVSAGAQLLQEGLQLNFGSAAAISLPALVADASTVGFVGENQSIPMQQFAVEPAVILHPKKMAMGIGLTHEMIARNAQAIIEDRMKRDAAPALDRMLFDSNPSDATRPAGLRYNIAALTASNASATLDAMFADLASLVAAVAPLSARPPILITTPTRAILAPMMSPHSLAPLTVLASYELASGDMIMVQPDALVSATGGVPQIEKSDQGTVQFDTVPAALLGTPGNPAVMAAPTRSFFQTDTIGLKLRFQASWALRDARGVAWLTTSKW